MSEYSVLIVEDELPAREMLVDFVLRRNELRLSGMARDAEEALARLAEAPCDILLLDVQLPGRSGLELLEQIPAPRPRVIFTTAFEEHALRAFEFGATDYLLKPFTYERFSQAVDRVLSMQADVRPPSSLGLSIRKGEEHHLIPYDEIIYVSSSGKTCIVHTEQVDLQTARLLKDLTEQLEGLSNHEFMRVHKQFIVNLTYIRKLQYFVGGRYTAHLRDSDETAIPVGKNFAPALKARLKI